MRQPRTVWSGPETWIVTATLLCIVAFVALLAPECGRKPAPGQPVAGLQDSARAVTPGDNPATVPHPAPPQPSGPQIGRGDAVITAIRPNLAAWAGLWAAALPGFAVDSLWRVRSGKWAPLSAQPFVPPVVGPHDGDPADVLAFEILGLHSPDGRYILDVDSYQVIVPGSDGIEVGGEPDSKCTLIDAKNHLEFVLQETGTGGGYQWGAWLSPTSFALGGWSDADDYSQWQQGRLWIYSLPDSAVTEYETRIVPNAAYTLYEAAWHGWLLKRYRALKPPRAT